MHLVFYMVRGLSYMIKSDAEKIVYTHLIAWVADNFPSACINFLVILIPCRNQTKKAF